MAEKVGQWLCHVGKNSSHSNNGALGQDNTLIGDRLGTLGATTTGLDADAVTG